MKNDQKNEDLFRTYKSVIVFIISIFILELYEVTESLSLIISVFLSMLTFMFQSAALKEKYGEYPQRKELTFQTGLFTVLFIIIFINGILDWYKVLHINIRTIGYFVLLLLYFIFLFKAVHILKIVRIQLENAKMKK